VAKVKKDRGKSPFENRQEKYPTKSVGLVRQITLEKLSII